MLAALPAEPGLSASEVSARTDVSRVTARRHLEHLVDVGRVAHSPPVRRTGPAGGGLPADLTCRDHLDT